MKTLTDVTDYTDFVEKVNGYFEEDAEETLGGTLPADLPYDREQFLSEAYMDEETYDTLVGVLRSKKNIILQGAPGVGKTFVAKRLAYSMMGAKDRDRVMMVQFHQSYSYEDFIEGFRPSASGFDLIKGSFYTFCKKAQDDTDNDYFFIVDEINRGNLSKIFGELFMLIENDKRGPNNKLQLLYSRERFYVPSNVYLIGMMNTADRSLAMLDYALRRRFAFFDLRPGFDSKGFIAYRDSLGNPKLNNLLACTVKLNAAISDDDTLGDGFCIGHSYFCGMKAADVTDAKLSAIVEYELAPMLREYWFDEPSKVREWTRRSAQVHQMIRIQNIYHMLAYAFQVLCEQGYREMATEEFDNAAELCAAILIRGTNSQVKRGLGREYIDHTDALSTLRGKFEITRFGENKIRTATTNGVQLRRVLNRHTHESHPQGNDDAAGTLEPKQRAQAGDQATARILRRRERHRSGNRELADALQSK